MTISLKNRHDFEQKFADLKGITYSAIDEVGETVAKLETAWLDLITDEWEVDDPDRRAQLRELYYHFQANFKREINKQLSNLYQ